MIPSLFILTMLYGILLYFSLKVRGITVLWIFNLGGFVLYHIGFWYLRLQEEDIYFLVNTHERMEQIVLDIIIFTSLSMFFLFILNSQGVRLKNKDMITSDDLHLMGKIIKTLSAIVFIISIVVFLLIDWRSAPLFNIGSYSIREMAVARSLLFKEGALEFLSVPRYITFYVIFPILFYCYGYGLRVSKVVLFIGVLFGLLTLAKTFIIINTLCLFFGFWFRCGGILPGVVAGFVLPSVFYLVVYVTYVTEVSRSFLEVLNVLLVRIIQVPIALVAVYKEIFFFDQGLRSSYWYTLIFEGVKAPIQQIAGQYLAPNAFVVPNAACGILGSVYPNIPMYLHTIYFSLIIGSVVLSSFFVSLLKNYLMRIVATIIIGLQSIFIHLTDPLTVFNSYGFMWSTIFVFLMVYGIPFLIIASKQHVKHREEKQCQEIEP